MVTGSLRPRAARRRALPIARRASPAGTSPNGATVESEVVIVRLPTVILTPGPQFAVGRYNTCVSAGEARTGSQDRVMASLRIGAMTVRGRSGPASLNEPRATDESLASVLAFPLCWRARWGKV